MTDRIHALTVVLERDIRDDDLEGLVSAIKHLRGVGSVEQHVADLIDHSARNRVRHELQADAWRVLDLVFQRDKDLLALLDRKRKR